MFVGHFYINLNMTKLNLSSFTNRNIYFKSYLLSQNIRKYNKYKCKIIYCKKSIEYLLILMDYAGF